MTDVIMPQMGESIAEGTITKWMKNVGDKVERDEPLFEISTDKVDAEIPSPAAGVLKEIRVQPGTTVPINTVVGVIGAEGEAAVAPPAVAPPAAAPAAAPAAVPAPAPPAAAAPAAPPAAAAAPAAVPAPAAAPAPAPTAPAAAPAPAPAAAPAAPPAAAAPAPAQVVPATPPPAPSEATPAQADGASGPAPQSTPSASVPPSAPAAAATPLQADAPAAARGDMSVEELRQTRSSPVVRKIAAEHNVDIREIPGTGVSGRVTKQDILGHLDARPAAAATPPWPASAAPAPAAAAPPAATAPGTAPVPVVKTGDRVRVEPMSPIRRKTAEHMVQSKRTSAHVTTFFEIDMTHVDKLRHKHRHSYEQRSGVKLTYLPFILKATVDALKAFPILNSSVEGDAIVYRHDINLGLAVALDWGLIVPVVRNADEKNVLGLARAVVDLADRARTKRLKVDEVQGGTFTVTNPGVFGSLIGTPIINQPQVAILGVGTIEKRPVVRDDAIAIRTMAYFALTFDHRIVDGSDADRFMAHIKKGLQEFDETAL